MICGRDLRTCHVSQMAGCCVQLCGLQAPHICTPAPRVCFSPLLPGGPSNPPPLSLHVHTSLAQCWRVPNPQALAPSSPPTPFLSLKHPAPSAPCPAVAVQQRLVAHAATARPMDEWHKRFSRLRRPVDGSGPVAEVLQVAADAAQVGAAWLKRDGTRMRAGAFVFECERHLARPVCRKLPLGTRALGRAGQAVRQLLCACTCVYC